VAKKGHLWLEEAAFLQVDEKTCGAEAAENLLQVKKMRGGVGTGDEDVIDINDDLGQARNDLIHQPLKGHASIF